MKPAHGDIIPPFVDRGRCSVRKPWRLETIGRGFLGNEKTEKKTEWANPDSIHITAKYVFGSL